MTISKTSLSQHVETVRHYARPAAEVALAADGTLRIWNAFQQKGTNQNSQKTDPDAINPKRKWDCLARFGLNPTQNAVVGVVELATALYLYGKK